MIIFSKLFLLLFLRNFFFQMPNSAALAKWRAAVAEWRAKTGHSGKLPKKGTPGYKAIMKLYKS